MTNEEQLCGNGNTNFNEDVTHLSEGTVMLMQLRKGCDGIPGTDIDSFNHQNAYQIDGIQNGNFRITINPIALVGFRGLGRALFPSLFLSMFWISRAWSAFIGVWVHPQWWKG